MKNMKKICRFFRRKYLFLKFKLSKLSKNNLYHLINLKPSDRGIGITTFLIKESIKASTPIIVRTMIQKERVVHEMYKYSQIIYPTSLTEKEISDKLVFTCRDNLRGKRINSVLIDSLTIIEYIDFLSKNLNIKAHGFLVGK